MNVLYIDYNEIKEFQEHSAKKSILFLKTLFDLTNKKSTRYNEINLEDEDLKNFINLLKKPTFRDFFITLDDEIELVSKIDGKIIVGMDSFLKDLNDFETLEPKSTLRELTKKLSESNEKLNQRDIHIFFNKLAPLLFKQWLFKYVTIPFIPYSDEGLKIYKESLIKLDIGLLKEIFNEDDLSNEIKLLPLRKDKGELRKKDLEEIRSFVTQIMEYIYHKKSSKDYWFSIRISLIEIFDEIEKKDPHMFLPEGYLFLVKKGNTLLNPRNRVISNHNGKIVVFTDVIPIVKKLEPGDIILGEIKLERSTFVRVDVKEKLTIKEASNYLKSGMKCGSSEDEILRHLENFND